ALCTIHGIPYAMTYVVDGFRIHGGMCGGIFVWVRYGRRIDKSSREAIRIVTHHQKDQHKEHKKHHRVQTARCAALTAFWSFSPARETPFTFSLGLTPMITCHELAARTSCRVTDMNRAPARRGIRGEKRISTGLCRSGMTPTSPYPVAWAV